MNEPRIKIVGPVLAAAVAVAVALAASTTGGYSTGSGASGSAAPGTASSGNGSIALQPVAASEPAGASQDPMGSTPPPAAGVVVHDPGPPSDVAVARGDTAVADAGHAHDEAPAGEAAVSQASASGVGNADQLAEEQPDQPLSRATRDALAAQLVVARDAALRYPTVADAVAAGYVQAGEFAPGAGAHYVRMRDRPAGFDPGQPDTYIYDGISPDSRVVGLMWTSLGDGGAPEGFAGPNDHWHRHMNVCIRSEGDEIVVPFPADSDITREMCDEVDGRFLETTTWMVHAWVVPSWDSPKGVFSHDNPNVRCADNSMNTDDAGFCEGT